LINHSNNEIAAFLTCRPVYLPCEVVDKHSLVFSILSDADINANDCKN
jgi:hypothetical protein